MSPQTQRAVEEAPAKRPRGLAAPITPLLFAFALGEVAGRFALRDEKEALALAVVAAAGAVACMLGSSRRAMRAATSLACLSACGLGALSILTTDMTPPAPLQLTRFEDGQPHALCGWLRRDGVYREGAYGGEAESLELQLESIEDQGLWRPTTSGARVSLFTPSRRFVNENDSGEASDEKVERPQQLLAGQRVCLLAKLHAPSVNRNPGAFDYAGWLRARDVEAVGSARANSVTLLPGLGGSAILRWRMAARRSVIRRIEGLWPQQQAGLFAAMLLGERAGLSRECEREFQRSGVYHLLVVSGMNVAIFAAFLYWLARRLRARMEWAAVASLVVTLLYASLTELGPPIVRAVAMLAIWQATRLLHRERCALNGVSAAALAMLAFAPELLFDASFQMTYLAVLTLAALAAPLLERTSGRAVEALRWLDDVERDRACEPLWAQRRMELRMLCERLAALPGGWLWARLPLAALRGALSLYELFVVSLSIQMAMTPTMVWYFHRAPWRAVWANLVAVPLNSALMPASLTAVALDYLWRPLALAPAWLAARAMDGVTTAVGIFGAASLHETRLATPPLWAMLLVGASLLFAMLTARRRRSLCALGALSLAASTLWLSLPHDWMQHEAGVLEITAIDVGQGDSLLIVTPAGRAILLDSGGAAAGREDGFDFGEEVTSQYLWRRGLQHLDAVAISHAHSDHIGGMSSVIANFGPQQIWLADNADSQRLRRLLLTAAEYGCGARLLTAGDNFAFGGAEVSVLGPVDPTLDERERDDDSLVLRLGVGATRALLTGDIHKKSEQKLLARWGADNLRADLLKTPHHGSATSTSPEFVAAVRPSLAVVSDGEGNPFGHPRRQTLETLAAAHVGLYRTDQLGPVGFLLDGRQVRVRLPR